jgi:hypothetical protein
MNRGDTDFNYSKFIAVIGLTRSGPGRDTTKLGLRALRNIVGLVPQDVDHAWPLSRCSSVNHRNK